MTRILPETIHMDPWGPGSNMAATALLVALLAMGCAREPDASGPTASAQNDETVEAGEEANTGSETMSSDENEGPAPSFCEGPTTHRWSITDTEDVDLFPDPLLEVADPSSLTGRRLTVTEETARWLPGTPDLLLNGVSAMDGISGFGTVGGILLRFDGGTVQKVPSDAEISLSDSGWQLFEFDGDKVTRVPFEGRVQEGGETVVIWPLRTLKMGTKHALVVTTDARGDDGNCIAPSEITKALLYGDELPDHPLVESTAERLRDTLKTLAIAPENVSIITVFTTHYEPFEWLTIAAEAEEEAVEWGELVECTEEEFFQECTIMTTVMDRRNEAGRVEPGVTPVENDIPVTLWLPKNAETPYPVVMYGHGLASARTEGRSAARLLAEGGFAMVAMDAIGHGDHPSAESDDSFTAALGFLGVDLQTISINPDLLRGNFDQTNLDRRRFLRLILETPDFDGDGEADFDTNHLGYLGISLGAILGSQLLAISPEFEAVILSVGGGRLMNIVTDTTELEDYMGIIESLIGSKERFERLVPIAQHVVDPADSALWGAHVLRNRFDEEPPPHVLLQVGIQDEVVPKSAGHMLARSMGVAHLKPVAEPLDLLTPVEGPLSGNGDNGETHALFQFDRVTRGETVGPAYHVDTPSSLEAQHQIKHFMETWFDTGTPEVVDPYSVFDTPSL